MNLANTLSMVVGGYFVLTRELTFGGYLAFVNSFWRAVGNVFSILQKIPEFHRYDEIINRYQTLLDIERSTYAQHGPEVRLVGIKVDFENKCVLDIPSFRIRAGERVLISGPNGSGKTTLLHILSGYFAPHQGEVWLPQRIASITAPPELPPLPLWELISDDSLFEPLGLAEHRDQSPEQLSSGQRQRAAIGVLLSQEADFYILDEPLANLDEAGKESILHLILEKTDGKAMVMVLHGEERYRCFFDRVVCLEMGRVVLDCRDHSGLQMS